MSIRFEYACDVCEKTLGPTHVTNLPENGKVNVPDLYSSAWWVRLREGDGSHREVEWHLCSEACLAKWAAEQSKARSK